MIEIDGIKYVETELKIDAIERYYPHGTKIFIPYRKTENSPEEDAHQIIQELLGLFAEAETDNEKGICLTSQVGSAFHACVINASKCKPERN